MPSPGAGTGSGSGARGGNRGRSGRDTDAPLPRRRAMIARNGRVSFQLVEASTERIAASSASACVASASTRAWLSASWTFTPGYVASLSAARSQRAPSAQELYARGVHLAPNTYEIGSTDLDVETAASIELALRKTQGATTFSASVYRYEYDGYIYADTLDRYEDFRLVRYSQDDARFTGVEGQVTQKLKPWLSVTDPNVSLSWPCAVNPPK